ncbi:hypothetical protein [Hymenobacter sp. UYP22]|uniref:hypothetical protein n=1 Tax=Hymenobacter sp. UYP22 TaxID=3156348 RepID=UPI00339836B0
MMLSNSAHIMQLVADLHERQVRFVALDLGIDTATPTGVDNEPKETVEEWLPAVV